MSVGTQPSETCTLAGVGVGLRVRVPSDMMPPSSPSPAPPGCRVESIYLNVESVSTHRERSEVSVSSLPASGGCR